MQYFNRQTLAQAKTFEDLRIMADLPRFYARETPEQIATIFQEHKTTYAELDEYASQIANGLIAEGVPAQGHVACIDVNTDFIFQLSLGCAKSNNVLCMINWRLAGPEIEYIVNNSDAEILFVGERFLDVIEEIKENLPAVRKIIIMSGESTDREEFSAWRNRQDKEDPDLDIAGEDIFLMMYTSGTTGNPKGVLLSNAGFLASSTDDRDDIAWNLWEREDVGLLSMPMFHIGGMRWTSMSLIAGCTTVILPDFDPVVVMKAIEKYKITKAFLAPAAIQFILQTPGSREIDYSSLGLIHYGGSPIPLELLKEVIEVFQCEFVGLYGLTETTAQTAYLPPRDHNVEGHERMRSVGKPLPFIQIRVEDSEGNILPPGEIGEICINSPSNMTGYWKLPEATAKTLKDGWLYSGDAGYFSEDGYLYIHDRIKDMIISGGENIYPAEVESAIFGHPALADVAVIGVPDDTWGEAVKAIVVLKEGQSATPGEIIAWARERIASYKAPKSVDYVDALARNPSGKLLKKDLKAHYWEGKDRMVN